VSELVRRAFSFPLAAGTLELSAPWALLLLLVPALAVLLLPAYRERQPAVRVPVFEAKAQGLGRKAEAGVWRRVALQWLLGPLVFVLLVAAAARPELVLPPIQRTESARDLLLAVDISDSMKTADFTDAQGRRLARLEAVKAVLHGFIERRQGDRVGLLVFGDAPHVQAPFTLDHELCQRLLGEVGVGMAGPRTMIGDALGLGLKLFERSQARQKVMVLMTDGDDTGSRVPPGQAAGIARSHGIVVHTVGIGDPAARGADLADTGTLWRIAEATGGSAFTALNRQELEGVYARLDEIEKADFKTETYRPRRPLFHWPLGAAALLLLAFYVLMTGQRALQEARA
jgi:Ca-activated chloride channel homolog